MAKKEDIQDWLLEALNSLGGEGTIVQICKFIWDHYEGELKQSGDLFFTWQYDDRWAAFQLRKRKLLKATENSPKGVWELA